MQTRGDFKRPITRRHFVSLGGTGAAMLTLGGLSSPFGRRPGAVRVGANPFSLGVASGDPTPDGVVLWTRLAPDPLGGGDTETRSVPVRWEVAEDERLTKVISRGEELARPALGHCVHAEVEGLRPGREYFYRFIAAGHESPVGRTKTAPPANSLQPLTFAVASCQHYEHGFYTAYRHMAREDLDVVLHLGDYIYEFAPRAYKSPSGVVRAYSSPEPTTLAGYRLRYAEHRSDPDLQAAHQAFAWVVTWDDHEVKDNYAGATCGELGGPDFLRRRAAAYQAYYEHMPLRRRSMPTRSGMQLYRRVDYGRLARFNVLDTRQYRDHQAKPSSRTWDARRRTLTGPAQERWLLDGLRGSSARWNVLAQQIFFARRDAAAGRGEELKPDAWDGYPAARQRISDVLAGDRTLNPIVLSGDVHANWANDLLEDYREPDSKAIGTEFVGTSISSGGDGADRGDSTEEVLAENPHIKFFNGQRGYLRCDVTAEEWRTDFRVVAHVTRKGAGISTRASLTVEAGKPGIRETAVG